MSGAYPELNRDEITQTNACTIVATSDAERTSPVRKKTGNALNGNRNDGDVNVNENHAANRNSNRGWRGVLRVFWLYLLSIRIIWKMNKVSSSNNKRKWHIVYNVRLSDDCRCYNILPPHRWQNIGKYGRATG